MLYLREVASEKKYPQLAFRSSRGILSLEKTFGLDRLRMRVYGYQDVMGILSRGDDSDFLLQADQDTNSAASLPRHKNIRGREYFSKPTAKAFTLPWPRP